VAAYLLVLSTVPSLKEARRLASFLLEKRLTACVNISPLSESHYWWKGKKERAREFLLLIKTRETLFKKLEKELRENHSYSVPEIITLSITGGSKKYLNWIARETSR
jgi:periplasmic divalent cation tolerance protein